MHIVGLIVALAMGAGLIVQDRKIQKLRALRRIDRAKYKEAQLTKGQHDRASLMELEKLRQAYRSANAQARREASLKHSFRRNCLSLKSTLDDKLDEIESLRSALDSANATIREMMGRPDPAGGESVLLQGEDAASFLEVAAASAGRIT